MSGKCWYTKNPKLLDAEKQAMQKYFPQFELQKLPDKRLCWVGSVNPRGDAGGVWTLMVIYDNDHPSTRAVNGNSIRVYSIKPDLDELYKAVGRLPHVWYDSQGSYFMCTSRKEDVTTDYSENRGTGHVTSAVKSLGWAIKWIWLVEGWLAGEITSDEIFAHTF